ncbi:hypothetical protein U1Q18_009210 [Sarracenia purpurea var. burkii]
MVGLGRFVQFWFGAALVSLGRLVQFWCRWLWLVWGGLCSSWHGAGCADLIGSAAAMTEQDHEHPTPIQEHKGIQQVVFPVEFRLVWDT